MKIIIKTTKVSLNPPLEAWIYEKIGGLQKFVEHFVDIGLAEARVEIGKTTAHHHKGEVWRAAVNIHVPKSIVYAEATHKDIRQAVTLVKNELQAQLKSYKESWKAKILRGERRRKRLYGETELLPKEKKGQRIRNEGV